MSIVTLYAKTFGTPLLIALLLWPFISAFLTLPILALLYHHEHRLRLASTIGSYLSVLYVVGLLTFTQYPMPDEPDRYCATHHLSPQLNPLEFIQDVATGGVSAVMQLLLNIVLFMPLGFLLMRFLRRNIGHTVIVGFLLSLAIELTQLSGFWGIYPCSYRQFDVDDLSVAAATHTQERSVRIGAGHGLRRGRALRARAQGIGGERDRTVQDGRRRRGRRGRTRRR